MSGGETVREDRDAGDQDEGTDREIAPEDELRANAYALLAVLLRREPDMGTLRQLAALASDETDMGQALGALAEAARAADPEAVTEEFETLFIGVGESEIRPYGSYYLTGFMYEKPLAAVRAAMADLGIARAEGVAEPEDHIAALCETMCALITGALGRPVGLAAQRAFFDAHIAPWAGRLFQDLETAESAAFYRRVGTIGRLFMRIEAQSFEMAA
ncbi:MAG: molecular chaperone TorD [Alphaproteobacteria bacterium]|nr:molecular chaperone TorD [Alphaproteobacteria bacterium]